MKKIIFIVTLVISSIILSGCGTQLIPIVNKPQKYDKPFEVIVEVNASPDVGISGFIPIVGPLVSSVIAGSTNVKINNKDLGSLATSVDQSNYYRIQSKGKLKIEVLGQTKVINVAPNQHVGVFATVGSLDISVYTQDEIREKLDFDYSMVK